MKTDDADPMPVQRESLRSREREAWHRDAARTRILEDSGLLLYLFVAGALLLGATGISRLGEPWGWAALSGVPACLIAFWGLRTGRSWARWVGAVVALTLAGGGLFALFLVEGRAWYEWIWGALGPFIWGAIAYDLLKPSARETFERARGE